MCMKERKKKTHPHIRRVAAFIPTPLLESQHCTEFTIFDISIGSMEWEGEYGEGKWD